MAKKTKESHPISIRMEKDIYEKLNKFCHDSGLSKTVAIERALKQLFDEYSNEKPEEAK